MAGSKMPKRILMAVTGVLAAAVSVGLFKLSAMGLDPFQSLMAGLDALIPISFGTLYVIINGLLLTFSLLFDRHYIGLGTVVNLFLTGYAAQFSHEVLQQIFPSPSMLLRIISLAAGIVILCFSSAFYFTADLGVSTYDAVALILSNKWHVADFQYCRIGSDFACVILGCLFFLLAGGKVSQIFMIAGAGTVITAFFMGPIIEFFNVHVARPFLEKD